MAKKATALIKVKQVASPIGRDKAQRKVLIGLGLNKVNKVRELEDTPSIRGMVKKVPHLVKIEE
ncbi:MAG: 50S ribosomal protein L30 [Alphaproteobacteria bacterium]